MTVESSIHDVARLAGVSIATVSRVLNGKTQVNEQTRRRVLEACRKLKYYPKAAARGLATGRTGMLGWLILGQQGSRFLHPSSWHYYLRIQEGMRDVLAEHGYRFWMEVDSLERLLAHDVPARLLYGNEVDGLFVLLQWIPDRDAIWDLLRTGRPLVFLNAHVPGSPYPSVAINNVAVGQLAAQHLLDKGCTRLACIAGPVDNISVQDRLQGFRSTLEARGFPLLEEDVVWTNYTQADGETAAMGLLARNRRPTGLFCMNDQLAAGALRAIRAAGLQCPSDVAVVSVDDSDVASATCPPLTTVQLPLYQMGAVAATLMVELLKGDESGRIGTTVGAAGRDGEHTITGVDESGQSRNVTLTAGLMIRASA